MKARRLALALLAAAGTAGLMFPLVFFGVLVLAGPHGGLLPEVLAPWVLGAGWLLLLLVPVWVGLRVWKGSPSPRPPRHDDPAPPGDP